MADNTSPVESGSVSMDDAVGSLLDAPPEIPGEAESAPAAPEGGDPSSEESPSAAHPSEDQPAAAEEAPSEESDEEPASDDLDLDLEAEGEEDLQPIDPPTHWKGNQKDLFSQLPRAHQQAIADSERARERQTDKALREAAEARKKADAEAESTAYQRQQYQQQLDYILPALQDSIAQEFSDIKTAADIDRMAREDGDRYLIWRSRQDSLQIAQQEHQRVSQQREAEALEEYKNQIAKANERLEVAFPEWRDHEKGRQEIGQLQKHVMDMAEEFGTSTDDMQRYLPAMTEPWMFQMARESKLYREAKARAAAKQVKKVPKVQRPGAAPDKSDRGREGRAAQLKRLEQTGNMEDAVDLLLQQ